MRRSLRGYVKMRAQSLVAGGHVMEIRIAEDEHFPEVLELLAGRRWDEEFDPDLGDVYVALDDGVIACLQVVDIDDETTVLDVVLVEESRRREGVGTALLAAATPAAPSTVYVSCRDDAVAFYESLGFALLSGGTDSAPPEVKEYWRQVGNRAPLAMIKQQV